MVLNSLSQAGLGPDGPGFWLIFAGFIAATVLILYTLKLEQRLRRLRSLLERARVTQATAVASAAEVPELKSQLDAIYADRTRLEMELAGAQVRLSERENALAEMKEQMDVEFRSTASKVIGEAHQAFLQRADETFKRYQQAAGVNSEKQRKEIDDLVKPMRETLVKYEAGLVEMRLEQQKARGELTGRIGDLARSANEVRLETQKLSTALRAGPRVRGRWGEEQLRNVVELAGMTAHVDFVEQYSVQDDDGRKQPDMVVSLPGERVIAVDSKVSLGAYLDAVEAENEVLRQQYLDKHAADLWAHVKNLSTKDYASALQDSLDFVIMFVPGENYFAAAMESKPKLFQEAFDRKVLIATPTTLVAILKSASYGWRQEKAAQNAQAVAAMAKELYESLRTMGGHLSGLGKSLDGAVKKYNDLLGGVEQRVMPRARKFVEFELPGVEASIEVVEPIERITRQPRDKRDLILPPKGSAGKSVA